MKKRSRKKKRFCPKGHDKEIVGKLKTGRCLKCYQDYHREYSKKWHKKNKARIKRVHQLWYAKNKKRVLKIGNDYRVQRMKIDPGYKLKIYLRDRIIKALKGNFKAGSAVRDLGCTIEFLIAYLQEQFYGDMTWKNYGKYWELDHIIALWKFDLTDRKQFLKAVNYKNMQPLTIPDHKKKTAKDRAEWLKHKMKQKRKNNK